MSIFTGKHIVLGVTGSIAVYKAADLASKLTQAGTQVDVILTPAAEKFITPLTFQSVTGRKAFSDSDLWGGEAHVLHVGLGHAADLLVIAPCTASTIAKLAHGLADNLLTITSLAMRAPILIAPAMDAGMYEHPATQENIKILSGRGIHFAGPEQGHMASGLTGFGRMTEPALLTGHIRYLLSHPGESMVPSAGGKLTGRKVVVTAGGTQEALDPVRILTNNSSGKQGYALAQAALDEGASVVLVTAPTSLLPPFGARVIPVRTAREMLNSVLAEVEGADALVMAAAVADFRPTKTAADKLKKKNGIPVLQLEPTDDILQAVGNLGSTRPLVVVGFAAETRDLLRNAAVKLQSKKLDLVVANDVSAPDSGFGADSNRVTLVFPGGKELSLPLMAKSEVAGTIIASIIALLENR
jgi:phosphopantothenoylcysteine decarboxylase / phosphopantothenate---cysteine ligase